VKLLHLATLAHVVHQVIGVAFAPYESHAAPQNPPIITCSVRSVHYTVKFDAAKLGAVASYWLLPESVTDSCGMPPPSLRDECTHVLQILAVSLSIIAINFFDPLSLRFLLARSFTFFQPKLLF
jgi:hypothetical protein